MTFATVLLAASTAVSAVGAIQEGRAAKQAANYNATVAAQNSQAALDAAAADESSLRRDNQRYFATLRAATGASGTTDEGSPLDIVADSAQLAELDALNVRYQGQLKSRGYNIEAEQQRALARNASRSGIYKAAGALFSGGYEYSKGISLGTGTGGGKK